jgi:glucokinase
MSCDHPQGQPGCAIGIDVGGTKLAAGLVQFPVGQVISRRLQPTLPHRGGEAVLADVVDIAVSLHKEAADLGVVPLAVGVGVAELVGSGGQILSAATIPWQNMDIRDALSAAVGKPATVDADVRAAARGEAQLGAGRPYQSFLYITVGTGISSSVVLDGVPYAGARGLSGSFASSRGLIPLDDGSLATGPALEHFASGPALAARFAATRSRFDGDTPEVIALAEGGDRVAREIVTSAAQALGAAIGQLVNVLDPQAIVIGGGLGMVRGVFRDELDRALRRQIWSDVHRDIPLISAELANNAGFVGAAWGALLAIGQR